MSASVPSIASVLTVPFLSQLPSHLASQLQSFPQLASLPLNDPHLLYRSSAITHLSELEKGITGHMHAMAQERLAQKSRQTPEEAAAEARGQFTAEQQQQERTYQILFALLQQVQIKYKEVEQVMQRSTAAAPVTFMSADDDSEPGQQQRQQSNVEMEGGAGSANAAAAAATAQQQGQQHVTPPQPSQQHLTQHYQQVFQQGQPQQQQQQPQQQQPQQAQPAPAATAVPASAAAAASSSSSSAVIPSNPTSSPSQSPSQSQPMMEWILPEGRRKLPGNRYQKIRTLRKTLFGKVGLYFDTHKQIRVAIKFSNKQLLLQGKTTSGNQVAENPLEELRFLRMLSRNNENDPNYKPGGPQHYIHPGQQYVLQLLDECEDEKDLWTVLEFCFAEDHQLLTNQGFWGLKQLEEYLAKFPTEEEQKLHPILFATFNPLTQSIQYQPAEKYIINEEGQSGEMIELTHASEADRDADSNSPAGISLLVTAQHDMFVQTGKPMPVAETSEVDEDEAEGEINWETSPDVDYTTGSVRRNNRGLMSRRRTPFAKKTAEQLLHDEHVQSILFQSLAPNGVEPVLLAENATHVERLQLDTEEKVQAFYELYGYWTAKQPEEILTFQLSNSQEGQWLQELCRQRLQFDSNLDFNHSISAHTFTISHHKWISFFLSLRSASLNLNCSEIPACKSSPTSPSDSHALASWVWNLGKNDARSLLAGVQRASSSSPLNAAQTICTPSVSLRDQLVHLCINAGYASYFNLSTPATESSPAVWSVSYTDSPSTASATASKSPSAAASPIMHKSRDRIESRTNYKGRSWCVRVANGLLFVRRAVVNEDGITTKASLPSIQGNCSKGEFFDIVCAANRFDEARARTYFIQLAQGVAYLHAHLICHLDLSLENILMDESDVSKICDFGVARLMELDQNRHLVAFPGIKKNKPGKLGYMAPELFSGNSFYGHLSDIYSMGVILFISLTGVPPYQMPQVSDARFKLIYEGQLNKLLTAWNMANLISPAAKDIISRMLCPPEKRMNIQQVLNHPFVTGAGLNNGAR